MSDTPRTDEEHSGLLWRIENKLPPNWQPEDAAKWMANFARTLERELNEASGKLSKLSRMIDIAGQANDAATEAEVANSATFAEALAHTNTEMVEAERDYLKAEVELFKSQLVKSNRDCLDARAEARDTTATDNCVKLIEKLGEVAAERDQPKAEVEQFQEVNFRQAQKINDIEGARQAFYNELAEALGLDPQNDENPPIVGEIEKLKAEVEQARKENDGLAKLLWEHPTAPCDQDSVSDSMQRVKALREERDQLKSELESTRQELDHMRKWASKTHDELQHQSQLRQQWHAMARELAKNCSTWHDANAAQQTLARFNAMEGEAK